MQRLPKRTRLFDKLHRAFVWTCIGISIAGVIDISYLGWNYYMYLKPAKNQEALTMKQELLNEGTSIGVQEISP